MKTSLTFVKRVVKLCDVEIIPICTPAIANDWCATYNHYLLKMASIRWSSVVSKLEIQTNPKCLAITAMYKFHVLFVGRSGSGANYIITERWCFSKLIVLIVSVGIFYNLITRSQRKF